MPIQTWPDLDPIAELRLSPVSIDDMLLAQANRELYSARCGMRSWRATAIIFLLIIWIEGLVLVLQYNK